MINISKYNHISFDLDGTLIDSLKVMEKSWIMTCKKMQISIPFEAFKKHIGLPFRNIMENLSLDFIQDEIAKTYFENTQKNIDLIELYPGAKEVLDNLKKTDRVISIITSKPKLNADNIIKKFGLNIDYLVAGGDTDYGKPFNDPYLKVLKQIENHKVNTIYFGDTLNDLIFSINSKVDYCHCNYGIEGRLSYLILPQPNSISSLEEIIYEK